MQHRLGALEHTNSRISLTDLVRGRSAFLLRYVHNILNTGGRAEEWMVCSSMLIAWIFNSLEKDLQTSVACGYDAKAIRDDLTEGFSQGNENRICEIKYGNCLLKHQGKTIS